MKLYVVWSESHRELYEEWFLPSLPKSIELHAVQTPQSSSGTFYTKNWTSSVVKKMEHLLDALSVHDEELCIYSDCDIQFFGEVDEVLERESCGVDLAIQSDLQNRIYCTGFFTFRRTRDVHTLIEHVRRRMLKEKTGDQHQFNWLIHRTKISRRFLSERFFTVGAKSGKRWNGEPVVVPDDILVHHANWTLGVENKIKLLRAVRAEVERKRGEDGQVATP